MSHQHDNHQTVTSIQSFNETIGKDQLVVVDYFATWCPPCKASKPLFEKLASSSQYQQVTFLTVDVDQAGEIAHQECISAMPTFKIYRNGKLLDTMVGANLYGVETWIIKHLGLPQNVERVLTDEDFKQMRGSPLKNPIVLVVLLFSQTINFRNGSQDDSYFNISVEINQDGILFKEYPFWPSCVGRGNSIIPFNSIREIIIDENLTNHAEIRTLNNEILFMRCDFNVEDLKKTNIPIYRRKSIDLWSDITEPFLDSSVPQVEEKLEQLINKYSIPREECEKIYSIISEPVFAYNFETMLWEYVSLDLVDVLSSLDKNCPLSQKPLSEEAFKEFYKYTNEFTIKYENREHFTL